MNEERDYIVLKWTHKTGAKIQKIKKISKKLENDFLSQRSDNKISQPSLAVLTIEKLSKLSNVQLNHERGREVLFPFKNKIFKNSLLKQWLIKLWRIYSN